MINFVLSFIGGFVGSLSAFAIVLMYINKKDKANSDQPGVREETIEDKRLFDADAKAIIEYAINKGLFITIQPNYDNVLWIFHHDKDSSGNDQMFAICEMVPGTYVQMVNKINSYVAHKEERQKEMKNAAA